MVRLSLVNLYLHGFSDPHIWEYDTLSSEDRWNESFDVILANPPFMSPKGGIRPHKKFSIASNRSEVLFVDYIAEHLNPKGRAGIIVPEGVIFQSGTAYKALRKMLVDNYLYAVVSLPAGIFNPYSGVKTSILLMDKQLAKQTDEILFVKIDNDGYGLGAQRNAVKGGQLDEAIEIIRQFVAENTVETQCIASLPTNTPPPANPIAHAVPKTEIAKNGDYNLSGERYKIGQDLSSVKYDIVSIGEVFNTSSGGTPLKERSEYYKNGNIPWLRSGEVAQGYIHSAEIHISEEGLKNSSAKIFPINTVLVAMYGATAGQVGILKFEASTNQAVCGILPNNKAIPEYLYLVLKSQKDYLISLSGGGAQPNISQKIIRELQIPLPPLSVQQEIVAEIEAYQKIIDGAKMVVENYKPKIEIDPEWEMVELDEIIDDLETGVSVNSEDGIGKYGVLKTSSVTYGVFNPEENKTIIPSEIERAKCNPTKNSIIISRMNTENLVGASVYVDKDYKNLFLPDRLWQTVISRIDVSVRFIQLIIASEEYRKKISDICGGTSGSMKNISKKNFLSLSIPLPPLETQHRIVAQIEKEQALVNANKQLIVIFEQKIKDRIARVWGGGVSDVEMPLMASLQSEPDAPTTKKLQMVAEPAAEYSKKTD